MKIEERLKAKGLHLPQAAKPPAGVAIPFTWARAFGDRVYISGHGPRGEDGMVTGPFGRVGADVTPEQGVMAARLAMLSVLGSVKNVIGDLDRITAWLKLRGLCARRARLRPHHEHRQWRIGSLARCLRAADRSPCAHRHGRRRDPAKLSGGHRGGNRHRQVETGRTASSSPSRIPEKRRLMNEVS